MKDHLIIFDTTLRDGEQSPGASMTREEKIRIARALERLKVDVIEAGFPAASPGDFEAVQAVANVIKDSTVCGLARALDRDIDQAGRGLERRGAVAHPHLYRHLAHPHANEIAHDTRPGRRTRGESRQTRRGNLPTMSNFPRKMRDVRKKISCAGSWKPLLMQVRRP